MTVGVAVIGLGKLGASMAAAFAARGLRVVGVDVDQRVVDTVNAGRAPVQETDLDDYLSRHAGLIHATLSYDEAVRESDVSFVIVPTPSDERGAFSLRYAAQAFENIGAALRGTDAYHTVALTSTVMPGATRRELVPILEHASGKTAGRDFGVCYNPEFVALGSVIRDLLSPDFILVGELDARSGDAVADVASRVAKDGTPVKRMSLENAELTKLAVNAYVTTKISFANLLAGLCEKIAGGDVDIVSDALGADARIGRGYLTGGMSFGGPCFPRDSVALSTLAATLGCHDELPRAVDTFNRVILDDAVTRVRELAGADETIAVLGLAYKPASHVVEAAPGIYLANALSNAGAKVVAYDPLATASARAMLRGGVELAESARACVARADVVLITTGDDEFKELTADDFRRGSEPTTVVDFWRILRSELESAPGIAYIGAGLSSERPEDGERLAEAPSRKTRRRTTGE